MKYLGVLFLSTFPILLLLSFKPMGIARGPYYLGSNLDPEYAYLMNSVNIVNHFPPGHRDHPGTTLQRLGGLSLHLIHPNLNNEQITQDVIQNPEANLQILAKFLLVICSLILMGSGLILWRTTGNLAAAFLFQIIPFMSAETWDTIGRFSPDLPTTVIAMLLMSLVTIKKGQTLVMRNLILGGLFGTAMATKITIAPFLLIPLIQAPKSKKVWVIFSLTSVAAFIFWIYPILTGGSDGGRYFAHWVVSLAAHKDKYGEGAVGLPSIREWFSSLGFLIAQMPLIPVALGSSLVTGYLHHWKVEKWIWGSIAIIGLQLLIASRHPNPRYLLPGLAACSLALVSVFLQSTQKFKSAIVPLAALLAFNPGYQRMSDRSGIEKRSQELALLDQAIRNEGCQVIPFYRSSSQAFALMFGNNFSLRKYTDQIEKNYQGFLTFDFKDFYKISGEIVPLGILINSGKKYCLRGWKDVFDSTPLTASIQTDLIVTTQTDDTLYRLRFK